MPLVALTVIRWPAVLAWVALAPLVLGLALDVARRRPRSRHLAPWLILCGVTAGLAATLAAACAAYDDLRSAAALGDVPGRPANRAWYALARAPALDAPEWADFRRQVARAAATALALTLVIPLTSRRATRARWSRAAARIVGAAAAGLLAMQALAQSDPHRPQPEPWLQLHAAAAGLVLALAVAAVSSGRPASKTFTAALASAAVAAILTGLAVAGWRPEQMADWLHHPRDLAHALAALSIPIAGATALLARPRHPRIAIGSATLLVAALVVALWTGALMLVDGSDGSDTAAELFRTRQPTVQLPDQPSR